MICRMTTGALLIASQLCFAQVKLGEVTVPRDHIIVYIAIGHSNMQSALASLAPDTNVFVATDPRIWNFNIADKFNGGPNHTWIPAQEAIHMRNSDLPECFGPTMPFLKMLLAKLPPDYYLGVVQNAEGRAQLKAHYIKDNLTDYGTNLYSQLHDAVTTLDTTVTWGGVYTMIGLLERTDSIASYNFATDMDTFIVRMRSLTKTPNLPLLVTQYEKGATGDYALSLYYAQEIVRQIDSIPSFVPFSRVIPTDWMGDSAKYMNVAVDHHFNPLGQIYWSTLASNIYDSAGFFPKHFRDTVPPGPPSNVSIDSLTCQGSWLSWTAGCDNVGCKGYRIVSPAGLDTVVYNTHALLPFSKDSSSITFTFRTLDLSSNQSSPVTVHLPITFSCDIPAPQSLHLIHATTTSLALQWTYGASSGDFLVYIADSIAAAVDSSFCTLSNLLPAQSYSIKVSFRNSKSLVSPWTTPLACTTKTVQVAGVPLYVDLAGPLHGKWVSGNLWCDSVSHGMIEPLSAESAPGGPLATDLDTVMATMFEGEMHYLIRVARDQYNLTLYLFDPFIHAAARVFNVSVSGTSPADTVISSPGLVNAKPWSAVVTRSVATDSIIEFSLAKASSLLPIASGFTLTKVPPFTLTIPETTGIGDTIHMRWVCDSFSVSSAVIYASVDSGKAWSMLTTKALDIRDPSWGRFNWVVPDTFNGQALKDALCMIEIADYNQNLFGTASCFIRAPDRVKNASKTLGQPHVVFGDHVIRFVGTYASGSVRIYRLNGALIRSVSLHKTQSLKLDNLPDAMYVVAVSIDGKMRLSKMIVR
jgi:Carbohydrate esterase, sialic acid-specific acetylesterase